MLLRIYIGEGGEKINAFLPEFEKMVGGGLVTVEKVQVVAYRGQS